LAIGDHRAMRQVDLERLYVSHAQGLFGFLTYRTGDRVLAEDLVADTFERALRARRRFDRRKGGEKAWLYAIALNLLRDHLRRRGAEARAVERTAATLGSGEAPDLLGPVETRGSLTAALSQLSAEEREAVALRFGGDLSLREIAAATGQSTTTAEGRVYRGLRKLRETLG
jgi:RNA polymerase sigma-70 factor (ECF subfamily)